MAEDKTTSSDKSLGGTKIVETPQIKSISTGIFLEDLPKLESIATDIEVSRSTVVRFAISDFLARYRAGKIELRAVSETMLENIYQEPKPPQVPQKKEKPMAKKKQTKKGKGKGKKEKKGKKGKKKKK